MTLVVPTSTSTARAARPALVETPTGGAAMARFGEALNQVGQRIETDRLDRQMKRLQVDMARDLNDLALETRGIGDPDRAEQHWQARRAQIRESYNQPGADGRPRLDPKNAEAFDLAFDDLANRHAFGLGSRMLQLRHAEREATFAAFTQEAVRTAATGDQETREAVLGQAFGQLADMVAAGVIDAAEAQARKIALAGDTANARAITLLSEDPDALLAALDAGELAGLGAEREARYRATAGEAIDAREAALVKAEEAALKDAARALDAEISSITDVARKGGVHVNEQLLDSPEAKARPGYAEAAGAISLRRRKVNTEQMTPTQIQALITAIEGKKVAEAWELNELEFLRAELATHETGYAEDPVGYARKTGSVALPKLPGFDPADPAAFVAGLQMQRAGARELVAKGYTDSLTLFSEAEKVALAQVAKDAANPQARVTLARALVAGLGEDARTAAKSLTDDPVFNWAVTLAGSGASPATLQAMLAGQGKLADKTARAPSRGDALTAFDKATEGAFRDLPDMRQALVSASLALYAEEFPAEDPADFDADAFAAIVGRAMGGNGDAGGIQVINPVGSGNEYTTMLPPGVSGRAVEGAIRSVQEDLAGRLSDVEGTGVTSPRRRIRAAPSLATLTAASLTGAAPDFGDPEAEGYDPAGRFGEMELVPVWADGRPADRYVLVRPNGAHLRDANGDVFQLSLRRLIRETRK